MLTIIHVAIPVLGWPLSTASVAHPKLSVGPNKPQVPGTARVSNVAQDCADDCRWHPMFSGANSFHAMSLSCSSREQCTGVGRLLEEYVPQGSRLAGGTVKALTKRSSTGILPLSAGRLEQRVRSWSATAPCHEDL